MNFKEEHIKQFNEWIEKQEKAKEFMQQRKNSNKVLIEVAAQHPLVDGLYPNEEFTKRLDTAINIYKNKLLENKEVEIYVPGSLHMYKGVADKISLAEAGVNYLVNKGINPQILHGEDLNIKYMKGLGCYNSADECYITTQYFKDGNFGELISVSSPAQMYRKTLFYIQFGVYPLNYSAPTENSFHNYINEIFEDLPYVLLEDNTCQGENSKYAVKTRIERNPKLNGKNPFKNQNN